MASLGTWTHMAYTHSHVNKNNKWINKNSVQRVWDIFIPSVVSSTTVREVARKADFLSLPQTCTKSSGVQELCIVMSLLDYFNAPFAWEPSCFSRSFRKGTRGECSRGKLKTQNGTSPLIPRTPAQGLAAVWAHSDFCVGFSDGHLPRIGGIIQKRVKFKERMEMKISFGEMVRWEKCLSCKKRGPELEFQHPWKSRAWCICNRKTGVGGTETGRFQGPTDKLHVEWKSLSQKLLDRRAIEQNTQHLPLASPHTCNMWDMHTHVHTKAYIPQEQRIKGKCK